MTVNQNVLWFDIAMNDVVLVQGSEALASPRASCLQASKLNSVFRNSDTVGPSTYSIAMWRIPRHKSQRAPRLGDDWTLWLVIGMRLPARMPRLDSFGAGPDVEHPYTV